ncbi:AAA family ATPase [Pontibacterium sp. N1Y112]|uniref:AAA family ATPase n=1 Tax=Pontibacterium sinense TaxID=2781979 RepID=A0A8J7FA61_9GAMM|nr:AAA family ATPase [Pontibacterium sinense]
MSGGSTAINASQTSGYFEPESRLQLVDKVRHLIRFSDFLLVLTGEVGAGKSTLLQQISPSSVDSSVHACLVCATSGLSVGALLDGLLTQLPSHVNFPDTDQGRLEALNEQVKVTRAQGQRLLLMVDDADLLSDDALALLINLQISHENNDGTAPQLLLLGKPDLADRLERESWLEALAGRVHHLPLAPFSDAEMQDFIRQTMPAGHAMTEKQLKAMSAASGGFPGRLGDAQVKPQKTVPSVTTEPVPTGRKAFPLPPLHMAGIALLLVVITAVAAWTFTPENEPVVTVDSGDGRVKVPLSLSVPGKANTEVETETLTALKSRLAAQEGRLKTERTVEPAMVAKERESITLTPRVSETAVPEVTSGVKTHREHLAALGASNKADSPEEKIGKKALKPVVSTKPVQAEVTDAAVDKQNVTISQKDPEVVAPVIPTPIVPIPPVVATQPEVSLPESKKQPSAVSEEKPKSASLADVGEAIKQPVVKQVVPLQPANKSADKPLVVERSAPVSKEATPTVSVPETITRKPVVAVKKDKVPRTARILADEKVLLALPAANYTLQLLGAREKESIERFLQAYSQLEGVRSFATLFKGKPWYVVVYGSFSDRKQAVAGIKTLPERLKKQRPWARSMKGIHSDINKR